MGETTPQRLRLSRARGFDLQAASLALNGLPAMKVDRSTVWGNPFTVTEKMKPGTKIACGAYIAVPTVEDAVKCFREMLGLPGPFADAFRAGLPELRGKNLACWCALPVAGEPDRCHAAVLIELANSPTTNPIPGSADRG